MIGEECICTNCRCDIPWTRSISDESNRTAQLFDGRFNFKHACSLFYFQKKSPYIRLIYKLKYLDNKDIGIFLGKELGYQLQQSELFSDIDYIVPIPLHTRRFIKRGYNQSEILAQGLSEVINKPVLIDVVVRSKYNKTQTKQTKWERFSNVVDIFSIKDNSILDGKKILLLDDIITTGATIESCCDEICRRTTASIYIASIGLAV